MRSRETVFLCLCKTNNGTRKSANKKEKVGF